MLEQISGEQNTPRNSPLQSCKVIFDITLKQTIWRKKTIFMLIATFLPVLLAIYYRIFVGAGEADPERVLSTIMLFFLQFLPALVALFYASSLIADEVDSGTIIYLFTRPVQKYSIIVGKFLTYILEVSLILVPPMLLSYLIIAAGNGISSVPALSLAHFGRQLGVTMLALLTYGAIFAFLGAWSKRPVVIGLLFAFGWEELVLVIPGAISKFSVVHYLISMFPAGKMMEGFGGIKLPSGLVPDSSPLSSMVILLSIIVVFLSLTIFTIYHKEYKSV